MRFPGLCYERSQTLFWFSIVLLIIFLTESKSSMSSEYT